MSDQKKKETLRAVKFVLFSISAGLIQAVSIYLLETFTQLSSWICYLVGLVLSVIWNFTLNRKFTFKSAANVPIAMLKVAAYYAVYTPLSTLGVKLLTEKCMWPPLFADGLAMALNLVTEFLYQRFFVFGKSLDTAPLRKAKRKDGSETAQNEE
jgi:putative flippase GtrA